ncbi:MAG: MFS transporter, partial [Microvirga sp.]
MSIGPSARLSALHAASFGGIGVYLPFFPIWLEHRGVPPDLLGVILALPIVVRIVAVAPLMALADRGIGPRRLIAGACCAVALVYVALLRAESFVALAALVVLMALGHAPIIPAADLVTIQAIRRDRRLDYGRIRLWGSIAFLAASIGGGYILGALPADAVIWLLLGLAVTAMATAWLVVPDGMAANADPDAPRPAGGPARLPLSLRYVIGAAACTQASHAALYAFGSI